MSWRNLSSFVIGSSLLTVLICEQSFAQLVQVGPGYVKAPFVRIYTDPDGGTHVRAPFTSVYTPGRRNTVPPEGHHFESPRNAKRFRSPLVSPANRWGLRSNEMNWQSLRRLVREGVAQLDRELSSQSDPQSWQDYLQIVAIADLVAEDRNDPPSEQIRQQLQEILRAYEATLNTNEMRSIHGRPGFRTVHTALTELVRPPLAHQRRLVAASARELQHELGTLGRKARGWTRHLRLTSRIFMDDVDESGSESADVELDQLAEIISRFDAVSVDPRYTRIAKFAGFQATHENLITYREMRLGGGGVESQPNDVGGIEPVPLPIEELPAPPPKE